jgi:hypothetical protein
MAGTLHVFRRGVVNGPALYQVNYTEESRTYAKVLEGEHLLREFLLEGLALAPDVIDEIWDDLRTGSSTIEDVLLSHEEAKSNDMLEAPSDF